MDISGILILLDTSKILGSSNPKVEQHPKTNSQESSEPKVRQITKRKFPKDAKDQLSEVIVPKKRRGRPPKFTENIVQETCLKKSK